MKMKFALLTFALSLLVGSAFGWPWGNVGIGTTGMPEEKLHVVGNLRVDEGIIYAMGVTNVDETRSTALIGGDALSHLTTNDLRIFNEALHKSGGPSGWWFYDNAEGDMRMTTFREDALELWGLDRDTTNVVRVRRYSLTPD